MIRPGRRDITIPQRASFREQLRFRGVDLTGYDAVAQVWDRRRLVKYADLAIEWVDRADGRLDIILDFPATAAITKDAYWDLLVIYPGGERHYWLEGRAYLDLGLSAPAP